MTPLPTPPLPPGLTLRRVQPGDAAAFAQLIAEPGVHESTMQLPWADEALWRERLQQKTSGTIEHDLTLVAERDGRMVGHAGLDRAPGARRRHVAHLGIVVARQAQGQGVGTALMAALMDYADRWAHLLRIELTVFADNARAIALYERFGFEREGLLRGFALRDGAYCDVLAMARFHPSPPTIRG